MRSSEDVRDRLRADFREMCARTGMFARTAASADLASGVVLSTLAYLDERDEDYAAEFRRFRTADFREFTPARIGDWFEPAPNTLATGAAEVFAWYAELGARFGWVDAPRLAPRDWERLLATASALEPSDGTWTRERVQAELPTPSFVVDGVVFCYAPPAGHQRWLFADIVRPAGNAQLFPQAPLRCFRLPGDGPMDQRIALTPAGSALLRSGG